MQIENLISYINNFAPLCLQEDYDNSGLVCGNITDEINSVLITIDVTEEVVDEAIKNGDNLIISHHPLLFKGIKNLLPDNYIHRALIKAIKNNIAIFSAHTNLDSVINGVNGRIADKLNLINRRILQPKTEKAEVGMGIIAQLQSPCNPMDFLEEVKKVFICERIRYSNICKSKISRVAICGGSGASLIGEALKQEADIYITGDIKYHEYFLSENKIILADIGHFESEQFTKEIFFELVTKKIPNFAVRFSEVKTNPVNYL